MKDLNQKQKKHLRKLVGKAYEAELGILLDSLYGKFDEWKSGKISIWDLENLIHQFHDKDARELYKFYEYNKQYDFQVAYAIRNGLISENELEESCRERVKNIINGLYEEKEDNN